MEEPDDRSNDRSINITVTIHNIDDLFSDIANEVVRKIRVQDEQKQAPLSPPPKDPDKYLTIDEVVDLIRLEKPTIYKLVAKRQIPYSKPPHTKKLLFLKSELIEWLKSGRRKPKVDYEAEAHTHFRIKKKK